MMKNFLKTIIFAFLIIAIGSCEEDIDPKVSANGFALRAPDAPGSIVLQPTNDADVVATLNWDKSDNGGMTSVSTYKVEVAVSGTNFANAVTANLGNDVTTADRTYVLTAGELNTLVNQLPGYACGVPMDIDIKVKSTLGAGFYNAFTQYSTNAITINVTPYSSALPTIAFSSDGIATDANKMASSGVLRLDYEGYMYLTPGLYKFYKPDACGNYTTPTIYGDDNGGSFNTLVANGSGYQVITAGFYLVKADLGTSAYSVRPIIWNLYGSGKQTFPAANSVMAYDQTANLWKITLNLANGYGFKFRSNGTGANVLTLVKYIPASVNTSNYGGTELSYVLPGGLITDNELVVPGVKTNPKTYVSYDIVLDLSSPRNYKYTITAH
jgi:hypothetical protein